MKNRPDIELSKTQSKNNNLFYLRYFAEENIQPHVKPTEMAKPVNIKQKPNINIQKNNLDKINQHRNLFYYDGL